MVIAFSTVVACSCGVEDEVYVLNFGEICYDWHYITLLIALITAWEANVVVQIYRC